MKAKEIQTGLLEQVSHKEEEDLLHQITSKTKVSGLSCWLKRLK